MSLHHILPKFILRGFCINQDDDKNNHEIMIYDRKSGIVNTEKINTAYSKKDFNSQETETLLCKDYENKIAILFNRIKKRAYDNEKEVVFSNEEYKLLFRFFTIMWRRNDIHIANGKQMIVEIENFLKKLLENDYNKIKNEQFEDVSLSEYFEQNEDELRKILYDKLITDTTDDDTTVLKTITNYCPKIVYNTSNIHFILHNTYGTMNYIRPKGHEIDFSDFPATIIEPISNNLCICLMLCEEKIDLTKNEYNIKIEQWNEDELVKQFFIDGYITSQATSFVVDNTNLKYVKENKNELL